MKSKNKVRKKLMIIIILLIIASATYIIASPGTGVTHVADDVNATGTFNSGDYTFPVNLNVSGAMDMPGGDDTYIQLPVLTATERDTLTPEDGMMIFCSTDDEIQAYWDGSWKALIPP